MLVASVLSFLLQGARQGLELRGILDIALEQDDSSETIVADQSFDFSAGREAVEADGK